MPLGTPPVPLQVLGAFLGLTFFAAITVATVVLLRRLRLKSECPPMVALGTGR